MKLLLFIILTFILINNIHKPVIEGLTQKSAANAPFSGVSADASNYVSDQDKFAHLSEQMYAKSFKIAKFGTDLCKIKIKEDDYKNFKVPAWCYPRREKGKPDTCERYWKIVDAA